MLKHAFVCFKEQIIELFKIGGAPKKRLTLISNVNITLSFKQHIRKMQPENKTMVEAPHNSCIQRKYMIQNG